MKASEFLEYVKESKSKQTLKQYKCGLDKFVSWYGEDLESILAQRKTDFKI